MAQTAATNTGYPGIEARGSDCHTSCRHGKHYGRWIDTESSRELERIWEAHAKHGPNYTEITPKSHQEEMA